MHPKQGQLRAYLDGETDEAETARLMQHLETCPTCQQQAHDLTAQARGVQAHLASLGAQATAPARLAAARARLESYRMQKENETMLTKIFARRWRPAWIAAALVLILGISLTFPPVQALASSFLGLFRVQTVAFVEVDPQGLPSGLGNYQQFDDFFADSLQVEGGGDVVKAADAAEASRLAGFTVRLPDSGTYGEPLLHVAPATRVIMTVDLPRLRGVLDEIGRSDISLPDNLDRAEIILDVPAMVTAEYGQCAYDPEDPDSYNPYDCMVFLQMPSPTITAPAGLDINAIGEAYLQLLGMSPEEARAYSQDVDWATTLVIPVPRNLAENRTIAVDGVTATLMTSNYGPRYSEYVLVWVKDGTLYGLSGLGDSTLAVELAQSLR